MTGKIDFFFYGTLCHGPLLALVLGREVTPRPAELADHAVYLAEGEAFPLILPEAGSVAQGVLVKEMSPEDVARLLREQARELDHERFWVVLLDTRNRMKQGPILVSQGVLNASLVHAREVFRPAVTHAAAAVILAHNHPSGDPSPSPEDLKISRELIQAGKVLGIKVLDHVIVGQTRPGQASYFHSLRESGLVAFHETP